MDSQAAGSQPRAVVTGANRGLGLELCRQLLLRGWPVVATCRRSSPELEALQAGAAAEGTDAASPAVAALQVVEGIDLSDDTCVPALSGALEGSSVGLVICNAGALSADNVMELDTATLRQQFEVNTLGPLRTMSALSARLAPGAKVALIGSKMGSVAATRQGGKTGSAGYRISKAAANMAGQLLAMELRQQGVPLVLIHPGAVTTDMFRSYWAANGNGGSSGAGNGCAAGSGPGGSGGGDSGPRGMAVSAHGPISPQAAAEGVLRRLDELTLEQTGAFVQAATGEALPW